MSAQARTAFIYKAVLQILLSLIAKSGITKRMVSMFHTVIQPLRIAGYITMIVVSILVTLRQRPLSETIPSVIITKKESCEQVVQPPMLVIVFCGTMICPAMKYKLPLIHRRIVVFMTRIHPVQHRMKHTTISPPIRCSHIPTLI